MDAVKSDTSAMKQGVQIRCWLIEEQLHEAQCLDALDALDEIHGIAQSQRALWAYHDANMQGQVHMTCVASFMERLQCHLDLAVAKYKAAHMALVGLQGTGDWEKTLQVLRPADVMNMEGAVFSIDEDRME